MSENSDLREAYKLAINARNFHYENYNKWMTYYYLAVAAIFVTFYNINTDQILDKIGLSLLGFIISILWHLSCKGYYFWIKNWTYQVKRFEDNLEKDYKVYTVFSRHVRKKENSIFNPIQSANISTSKLNLILSIIVSFVWGCIAVWFVLSYFEIIVDHNIIIAVVAFLSTYVLIIIGGFFLKSDLSAHETIDP